MCPSSELTREQRALRARAAAHTSWANTPDRAKRTEAARKALDDRFLAEAEGDPERAASLRSAYFARLSYRSSVARSKSKKLAAEAAAADAQLAALGAAESEPEAPVRTPHE